MWIELKKLVVVLGMTAVEVTLWEEEFYYEFNACMYCIVLYVMFYFLPVNSLKKISLPWDAVVLVFSSSEESDGVINFHGFTFLNRVRLLPLGTRAVTQSTSSTTWKTKLRPHRQTEANDTKGKDSDPFVDTYPPIAQPALLASGVRTT